MFLTGQKLSNKTVKLFRFYADAVQAGIYFNMYMGFLAQLPCSVRKLRHKAKSAAGKGQVVNSVSDSKGERSCLNYMLVKVK